MALAHLNFCQGTSCNVASENLQLGGKLFLGQCAFLLQLADVAAYYFSNSAFISSLPFLELQERRRVLTLAWKCAIIAPIGAKRKVVLLENQIRAQKPRFFKRSFFNGISLGIGSAFITTFSIFRRRDSGSIWDCCGKKIFWICNKSEKSTRFETGCQDFLRILEKNRGNSGLEAVLLVIFLKICYYYEKYVHACDSLGTYLTGRYLRGMRAYMCGYAFLRDGLEAFLPRRKTVCGCSGLKKQGGFSPQKGGWLRRRAEWASV